MPAPLRLACFVSPHGFGHAGRCCATIEGLGRRRALAVELFTTVPEWFFADSLAVPFRIHPLRCDVGLAQRDAMSEDLAATADALDALLPFREEVVAAAAEEVRRAGCAAVLCDVAPLGIAVARAAGVPAALQENFTWDWIYQAYGDAEPRLQAHARTLAPWFAAADLHLQTTPACRPQAGAVAVPPVARRPRRTREEVRRDLGLAADERAVLVTMGGIAWDYAGFAPQLPPGVVLVVPGGAREPTRLPGAVLLPFHSRFYHPDLMLASDAVVGKLGYSTFAEAWTCGVPYGFVPRTTFAESAVLADFVVAGGAGMPVSSEALAGGDWGWLAELLTLPRRPPEIGRGADAAAAALDAWLG